jgi:threonylcarbamoyladenosine tRNA methylthiotransferase MtaB
LPPSSIPQARGASRSDTVESVLQNARNIADMGVKEIVLTGVNIGDFGATNGETFLDLIKQLDSLEGIERYRISSIEPNLLEDAIIEFVANSKKFMPHFHIPLQSGSDTILQSMRRRYRSELYRSRIERIKSLMPDAIQ